LRQQFHCVNNRKPEKRSFHWGFRQAFADRV